MDIKVKALCAIAPFAIAIGVASTLAYPAYNDYTAKATTLEEKKHEEEGLATKLAGKAKLLSDKKLLEEAVEKLRSSVPKKPDLDLLNIDLEKMCLESGMDLVSFKEADKEKLKAAGLEPNEADQLTSAQKLKNKIKGNVTTAQAASSGGAAGGPNAKKGSDTPDTGLLKLTMHVKAIGDYAALMQLVRKLETYQRVVAISEVKSALPKRVEMDKSKKMELPDDGPLNEQDHAGDYRRLNCQFLLTAYYLP